MITSEKDDFCIYCPSPSPQTPFSVMYKCLSALTLFFVNNFICWFIYWLCWVFIAAQGLFSSCGEQGLLSSCGAWASHCGGFSFCRAWTLGHKLSSCGAGVSCSLACGIFLDQGSNPCLMHWQVDYLPLSQGTTPKMIHINLFTKQKQTHRHRK